MELKLIQSGSSSVRVRPAVREWLRTAVVEFDRLRGEVDAPDTCISGHAFLHVQRPVAQ